MGCRYGIACYERPRAQDTAAAEPSRSAVLRASPAPTADHSAWNRQERRGGQSRGDPGSDLRAGIPDIRCGAGQVAEPEAGQDGLALGGCVHIQVAVAAGGGQLGAVGDQGAVDPRPRQLGSVPPPHKLAKLVPGRNSIRAEQTGWSPAMATTMAVTSGQSRSWASNDRRSRE